MEALSHLLVDSKLIQDYQMSSVLKADTQVVATHFEGKPAYLSLDVQGSACFTYRDQASAGGWKREYLGWQASHIAAAHDSERGTVLLAVMPVDANGAVVVQMLSRKLAAEVWRSDSFAFTLGSKIAKIRLKNIRGKLYCLFIYQLQSEDENSPYRMAFAEFKYGKTTFEQHIGRSIDSLNADLGVGARGDVGAYVLFSPQIYWRPQYSQVQYTREFFDKGNRGTSDGQNITVWKPNLPTPSAYSPGYLAQEGHRNNPEFNASTHPIKLAYPLEDPTGSSEYPLLKKITKWKKVYDTHGTTTSDHQDFSLLQPDMSDLPGYRALGCIGIKNMDPNVNAWHETYAIHKDFAAPAIFTQHRNHSGTVEKEGDNDLGIWYTGNCGGDKKCASVSRIVPAGSSGIEIGTFYARSGCGAVKDTEGSIYCPAKHPKRKSTLLFMPLMGDKAWQAASVRTYALGTSLCVVESSQGPSDILCRQEDGHVYRLQRMGSGQLGEWSVLKGSPGIDLARVWAAANGNDDLNVFATSTKGYPFHALLTRRAINAASGAGEEINSFLPLLGKGETVTALDVVADPARNISVFAMGYEKNVPATLFWVADARTGNWTMQSLHTDADASLQEIRSFSVQVSALDKNDLPLMDVDLRIWAEGPALVKINGKSHFLDKENAVELDCLLDGRCSIMIPTNTIHVPILHVHASFMESDEYVSVSPNADIQIKLAGLNKPGALATAQKNPLHSDPKPLFPPGSEVVKDGSLDQIGAYLSQSMQLLPDFDYESDLKYLRWNREVQGRPAAKSAKPHMLARLAPARELHFGLRLERGRAQFFDYTPTLATQKVASFSDAATVFKGAWGDAWNFIKNAGADIARGFEVLITTVGKVVKAAVTFVINGVKYFFEAVVSLVQEVFTMVEGIFSTLGVAFEDLVQWLGYLFDWNDILRTKKAIQLSMEFGFEIQKVSILKLKNDAGVFIDGVKDKMDTAFDAAIAALDPGITMGTASARDETSPETKSINSHNLVFNSLMDNGDGLEVKGMPTSSSDVLEKLARNIERDFSQLLASPRLRSMVDRLINMPMDGQTFLSTGMAVILELIKDLADLAINIAKDLLDALLELLIVQIGNFQAALNATWNVPMLTALYKKLTNESTMSTMDLFSLVLAVPVTPLYKIARGIAPFPDEGSITRLEQYYRSSLVSAQSILSVKQKNEKRGSRSLQASKQDPLGPLDVLQGVTVILQFCCKTLAIVPDCVLAAMPPLRLSGEKQPLTGASKTLPEMTTKIERHYVRYESRKGLITGLAYCSSILALAEQLFSFPFGCIEQMDTNRDPEGSLGAARLTNWGVMFIPPSIDFFKVLTDDNILENHGDTSAYLATALAVIKCLTYAGELTWELIVPEHVAHPTQLAVADFGSKFLKSVPGVCAFLRTDAFFYDSDGASVLGYSAIKGAGKTGSMLCDVWKGVVIGLNLAERPVGP